MYKLEQSRKKVGYLVSIILTGFIMLNQALCQPAPLKIGISKASPNYVNWLKRSDPGVQTVDLYMMPIATAVQELGQCSGLLLTGGEDVYPGRYGHESDTLRCTEMNPHRDSLDMALIEKALGLKMPVIGVCRGHQVLNVFLGGTLIIDIPEDFGKRITHQCDDYLHCFHEVNVKKSSMLQSISLCASAPVTTNHHQAVDQLSPMLVSNAASDDSLIEGIEWQNPENKSFLIGVQWHPERMDSSNPLSSRIAEEFLLHAATYSINQLKIKRE